MLKVITKCAIISPLKQAAVNRGQSSFTAAEFPDRMRWFLHYTYGTNGSTENYQLFHLSLSEREAEAIGAQISNYSRLSTIYHGGTHGLHAEAGAGIAHAHAYVHDRTGRCPRILGLKDTGVSVTVH